MGSALVSNLAHKPGVPVPFAQLDAAHKRLYVPQGRQSACVPPAGMAGIAQGQAASTITPGSLQGQTAAGRACQCSPIAASMQVADLAGNGKVGTHLQHPGGWVEPGLQTGHTRDGLKVLNQPATLLAQVTL